MKRNFKFGLSSFALMMACGSFVGTQASALDIQLHGRVDFLASIGEDVSEQKNQAYTGPAHATLTGAQTAAQVAAVGDNSSISGQGDEGFIAYLDDHTDDDDAEFGTTGRVDVKVMGETAAYDYGAFVRIDVDPGNATASSRIADTDGHVFIKGNFGSLQFGTDIDADQDAYDMDLLSAGPMSVGNSVSLPIADHAFSMSKHDEASIVYTSPSFSGVRLSGEIDDDGDWMVGGSFVSTVEGIDVSAQAAADNESFAVRGKLMTGDWSFGALAGFDDDDESYWGGGVGYRLGQIGLSVEASLANAEFIDATNDNSFVNADELDVVGGISYQMASGLSLAGSVGYFEREVEGNDIGSSGVTWAGSGHQLSGVKAQGRIRLEF